MEVRGDMAAGLDWPPQADREMSLSMMTIAC